MHITKDYNQFDPHTYLQEYYCDFPPEYVAILQFLIDAFRDVPANSLTLDFGGGPTLYSAFVAAGKVEEIHFSEYVAANRCEVEQWLNNEASAFDWSATIEQILHLEGTNGTVSARAAATRSRITQVMPCDATQCPPVQDGEGRYDVVMTHMCVEAVARDVRHWQLYMANVASLLKSGGRLIMTTVRGGTAYSVGNTVFPVAKLYEYDVLHVLNSLGFTSINIDWTPADHPVYPYEGLMLITAVKQ